MNGVFVDLCMFRTDMFDREFSYVFNHQSFHTPNDDIATPLLDDSPITSVVTTIQRELV